jgi:hypothetical protein
VIPGEGLSLHDGVPSLMLPLSHFVFDTRIKASALPVPAYCSAHFKPIEIAQNLFETPAY